MAYYKAINHYFYIANQASENQPFNQSNQTLQSKHHFFFRTTAGSTADKRARAITKTSKQRSSKQGRGYEKNDDLPTEYPLRSACSCLFGNASSSAVAFVTFAAVSSTSARSATAACKLNDRCFVSY